VLEAGEEVLVSRWAQETEQQAQNQKKDSEITVVVYQESQDLRQELLMTIKGLEQLEKLEVLGGMEDLEAAKRDNMIGR
jgi:glucan phosphorylase